MNQILSIALIVVALFATYTTPAKAVVVAAAKAHNAASACTVTQRSGGKRVFVTHVKDGAALWLTIDGVTKQQIYRGPTATGSNGAVKVNEADGWTEICSG